jgi:BlaI family penicillinase repressor
LETSVPEKVNRGLAPREQQIMDLIYRLGKASVADVRELMPDAPSYSAVRTMIGNLERKGHLRRNRDGVTHVYSPVQPRRKACRSALRRLVDTFFPDSPSDAIAAFINDSAKQLTDEDLNRLQDVIDRARKEG